MTISLEDLKHLPDLGDNPLQERRFPLGVDPVEVAAIQKKGSPVGELFYVGGVFRVEDRHYLATSNWRDIVSGKMNISGLLISGKNEGIESYTPIKFL